MSKYNEVFKQKIVDDYLASEGDYTYLAKRFGVRSKKSIRQWVSVVRSDRA